MIDLLRIMSLFGGGQQQPGWQTPGFNPYEPTPTFSGMFNPRPQGQEAIVDNFNQPNNIPSLAELYKPNMEMQERFRQLLAQFPQRTEPSGWRKFGAVLTGLGGENAGEAMQLSNTAANLPYMMKLQDWQHQAGPVLKAVDDERAYNQQNLGMANQQLSRMLDERRVSESERYNRERTRVADERLDEQNRAALERENRLRKETDIKERYAVIAEFKRDNPAHRFFTLTDGSIVAVDPTNPTDQVKTGLNTGDLGDAQRLALQLKDAKEMEAVRQTNRVNLENQRNTNITNRPRTPSSSGGELEETRRVENRKRQMMLERKDLFDWINPATGTFKNGTPENIKREINQYVYGETRRPLTSVDSIASGVPFNKPGTTPSAPIQMRTPDGRVILVPPDKVAEAETRGAKRVQ